ncbi:MAG: AtpZ/AtpI family protein [Caldilineae bacterium]|nr:MAG: AtpZ/AtpI family protein [Caldilineae bacterium]
MMQQRQNAKKHPEWVRLAIQLSIWVALALFGPLLLGLTVDTVLGTAPWGLLGGMVFGMTVALILLFRSIQSRYLALAPPETEEEKENS